jgi:hypothetical protein
MIYTVRQSSPGKQRRLIKIPIKDFKFAGKERRAIIMTLFTETTSDTTPTFSQILQKSRPNDAMPMLGNPIRSSRNHVKVWGSRTRDDPKRKAWLDRVSTSPTQTEKLGNIAQMGSSDVSDPWKHLRFFNFIGWLLSENCRI